MRYLRLYRAYIRLGWQSILSYRADALLGAVGFLISNTALILSIGILFNAVEEIGGWTFWEMLLLFSFISTGRALWDIFMVNMINLPEKVQDGSFDRLLLRPVNPLFQLLAEKLSPDTFGELFVSVILIGIVFNHYGVLLSVMAWLLLIVLAFSSMLVFAAVHLVINSTAFWIINNDAISFLAWRFDELTRYPLSIYPRWLSLIVTWFIPFGFAGYYPMMLWLSLFTDYSPEMSVVAYLSPFAGPVLFLLAYQVWRAGLRAYTGTGS